MRSFYEADLANVHHSGFTELADLGGNELLKVFEAEDLPSGCVIDLGCGSGVWARKLVDRGYEVLGIDVSQSMIDLARRNAPGAEFQIASVYDAALRPCAAVTALGEVLNYCAGGEPSNQTLGALFESVADNLKEGGVFVFDVIVESDGVSLEGRSWRRGPDWAVLWEVSASERNLLSREIIVFRKIGDDYACSSEQHQIRVFDPAEISQLLSRAGFRVTVSSSYGSYRLAPARLAFLARKAR